ncbi:conserved hypothetical protein [groundwater metagenome]|uniref:Uncharacterized protein n=1 Tax=groundwater metagenome TaxID=717931 RepID=A0A098EEI5_9ZZZZ
MRINRDFVLSKLEKLQNEFEGYYGTDLTDIANELGVTWHGLQKRYPRGKVTIPHLKVLGI